MNLPAHRLRGFTLVELMITISVLALLVLASVPSLQGWVFNGRVRTSAESLQNGLRLAQAEAARQSRQVVFGLTVAAPALNAAMAANGRNWLVQTVPSLIDAAGSSYLRGGPLADVTGGVTLTGPAVICFSSAGGLVANAAPGAAGAGVPACALPVPPAGGGPAVVTYDVAHASAERRLRVTVSVSGRVRMCDPDKALTAANPDGC